MHDLIAWFVDTKIGPFTVADAAGFATGALCVWLVVRQHVANFAIGLLNNVFFLLLFVDARLYADAGLQVVYVALGVIGWYWWLRGGEGRTELPVSRTPTREWVGCALAFAVGFVVLTAILREVNGAAPPVDAATTTASLVAQYLLTRKRLENWWVWIAVDVVYVPLYLSRDLPLTGLLYLLFIGLCVAGLRSWQADLDRGHERDRPATASPAQAATARALPPEGLP